MPSYCEVLTAFRHSMQMVRKTWQKQIDPVSEVLQKPGESRKDELIPPPNEESHPLVMGFGQGAGVIMCLRQKPRRGS